MSMDRGAAIPPFRMAIMWIIWSMAICIIRTATTATTTGRSNSHEEKRGEGCALGGVARDDPRVLGVVSAGVRFT